MWTSLFPEPARRELYRIVSGCGPLGEDPEPFLASVFAAVGAVPPDVARSLLRFRADPAAPGALLVRGMPIDRDLPPTPRTSGPARPKESLVSEASILLIALLLGEPVAYAEEKDGSLVQDVYPIEAERRSPSNESSELDLEFHTELSFSRDAPDRPFHEASPDFLLLLGLRAAPRGDAVTTIVEARDVSRLLSDRARALLRRPLFQLRAPYSYTRANGADDRPWSDPVPLFHGPEDATTIAFDLACGVRGTAPAGSEAIEELREAVSRQEVQRRVCLEPGDLLLIDNRKCAHARSRFEARFDGRDRWMQRAYVRRSLDGLSTSRSRSFRVL